MKIAIGCDEVAYNLKMALVDHLQKKGVEVQDFGTTLGETVLYPKVAFQVADKVGKGEFERAILLCGTGIGMSICANKVPGVRAAVCHDVYSAERARKSNNAQILCMGQRVIGVELAKCILDAWLSSDFAGGESAPKVALISELEDSYRK